MAALRAAIVADGRPITAIAAAAGLSHAIVSRFCRRERGLTIDSFDRLAAAVGLRVILSRAA